MTQNPALRIASIDILRALTMVLMIFVNDLWSLTDIPTWLEHVSRDEDGMGLADVVFPAFLFIVGMSLPFAVSSRVKKGDTNLQIIGHIVIRSVALIVMGVFLVNGENINAEATGMHRLLWNVLSCTSFILIWNSYPAGVNKWVIRFLKALGIVTLIVLAFLYRAGEGNDIHGFSTYWWGILGLIGWAYLACGVTFVLLGKNLTIVTALWLIFNLICVAVHAHWMPEGTFIGVILGPLGNGAMPSFVMGGTLISMIYLHFRDKQKSSRMLLIFFLISVLLLVAGFYTRPYWEISKIRATPSWVWICSAITILSFIVIYWIADIKGKATWFEFIKPAGTNTLLCYLIPYFAYAIVVALGINFPALMLTGIIGLIKSMAFALLVVWIAGRLGKLGLQLKL
jgi:heparan-alpha-glucosaminide N-acetyltransferase